MKQTQNRRTLNDVARYIQMINQDGVIKKSMMEMAKEIGYSNATIHRSIQRLQEEGMIQVVPSKSQREPNTIVYLGPHSDDLSQLVKQAHTAVYNLNQASLEVGQVMSQLQETVMLLSGSHSDYAGI